MSQIILDFGSGNSCLNDKRIIREMYLRLKEIDSGKHNIICKWQLFKEAGENIPLNRDVFDYAYSVGTKLGYQVTSSVFDMDSLMFLLEYKIPMVKIANRRDLDWLGIESSKKGVPVCISYGSVGELKNRAFAMSDYMGSIKLYPMHDNYYSIRLLCVSKYPATLQDYESTFDMDHYIKFGYGVSDHTTDFQLWHKYKPETIEWHYVLEHDPNNLDGGPFARTPTQLREVL